MSDVTKKYKIGALITTILSMICVWGPLLYFLITGWNEAGDKGKYILCSGAVMALILTGVNAIFKYHLKSVIYILLIVLTMVFENALPIIITFCALQIVDEIILSPLSKHYRSKYSINKEIDKRG